MELHNTEEKIKQAVLVGVHRDSLDYINDCTDESMEELELLTNTAGAEVVAHFVQNRPSIDNATYIGEGKAQEIAEFCEKNDIDVAIFDDELTGSQIRNIEERINIHVMDRSSLILDIFAMRAKSSEGKLQVELAQLKYYLSRLTGSFVNMSRLGGGIGTRGPGETKLETDRRHIRDKISFLRQQIEELRKNRTTQRKKRIKEGVLQVAFVGYTNAGKSTLLNYLTNAGVLAEDKLFATLDPTSRMLELPDGTKAVVIDTVGFIRKLPHHLIDAFKSTLEEVTLADVLVHVVDSTSLEMKENVQVVNDLLDDLGAKDKPIITAYNKCDKSGIEKEQLNGNNSVNISAKNGDNIDKLLKLICENAPNKRYEITVEIPFSKSSILPKIHDFALIKSQTYTENGTLMEIIVDEKGKGFVRDYIV